MSPALRGSFWSGPGPLYRMPLDMSLVVLRYATHRVPLFRRGRRGGLVPDPPDLHRPLPGDPASLQLAAAGHGPLYHRCYRTSFTDADLGPEELMAALQQDLNAPAPTELAQFEAREQGGEGGQPGPVEVGREYVVRLPGPWNGPVRVVEMDPTSFTLVTLDGHMEAGQITFSTGTDPDRGWSTFQIESFATCGTRLYELLYRRIPLASEMQLHMWASFCDAVVKMAGGVVMTSVEVDTHTYADEVWRTPAAVTDA